MPIMEQLEQVLDLIGATVQQGHDPANNYQSEHFEFSESMISAFSNSPTAQKYKSAYEMFQKARIILDQYTKSVVDTESDYDFLQPALHGYAEAYMCDNIWYDKFKPPENAPDLVDRYLIHRQDDILSDFCKHVFVNKSQHSGSEFSKFKHLQIAIRNESTES
ncbi:unnamed protein product [Mytilus coruscus]|uniref:Uncharacterized protein n=1 Tax=Mytilus coruscus TaxID=42192 RepID=A0A6J8CE09_MYTCO|nr:unnamed protein product [Mytilus coruscus]